ncbi:MAG: hypothetical protein JXR22_08955 [Prolixibacteraceae bacterium]|nr:hypothetical protein [Prolixibacteraceae bacterium]
MKIKTFILFIMGFILLSGCTSTQSIFKQEVKERFNIAIMPMYNYTQMDGRLVPSYGEAIWHYSDGNFVYAKFNVKKIHWNLKNPYKL